MDKLLWSRELFRVCVSPHIVCTRHVVNGGNIPLSAFDGELSLQNGGKHGSSPPNRPEQLS